MNEKVRDIKNKFIEKIRYLEKERNDKLKSIKQQIDKRRIDKILMDIKK